MAYNDSKMKNLPIVIGFDQGTCGRFLQAIINRFIAGRNLPAVATCGSAHDASEGEQNVEFILLWNDEFCDRYVNAFPQSINATEQYINMPHWNADPDKYKYYLVEDINRAGYDVLRATMIAEYMNSTNSAPVIRTHLTNIELFRTVRKLVYKPVTNIFITLATPEDKASSEVYSAVKNYGHLYPDPYSNNVYELYANVMQLSKSRSDSENYFVPKLYEEQENEFFFDFSSIVNKNIPYIINFVHTIARHCCVSIPRHQIDEIYQYIKEYVNKQPNLNEHLTRYNSNLKF